MPATIIDSLIVELGLDPSKFTKGQKSAGEALLNMRRQAQKDGKETEKAADAMAASFSKVTLRVLELGTAFLGLRGLERHITAMTSQDVQLSRFAQTVGMTAKNIAELEMATQRLGGTKAGADSSIHSVAGIVANFQQGRGLPPALQQLFARTGTRVDLAHLTTGSMMTAVATALQREAKVNPVLAASYASQIGLDPIFALMAEQHGGGLMGYAGSLGGLAPSQQALESAQKIVTAWISIRQQVDAILQHVIADAGPAVAQALQELSKFLEQHGPELERILGQDIQAFIAALEGANWKAIEGDIGAVAKAADEVARALGGWGPALLGFGRAWLLLKGVGILRGAGAAIGAEGGLLGPMAMMLLGGEGVKQLGQSGAIPTLPTANAPGWLSNSWVGSIARFFTGTKAPKPSGMSPETNARAKQAYDFFVSNGYSPQAASAIVGNLMGESGLNPHPSGGDGVGIAQWHADRVAKIKAATGIDVRTAGFGDQLKAFLWELRGGDGGMATANSVLMSGKGDMRYDVGAIVNLGERSFDRWGDTAKRTAYGNQIYSKFGARTSGASALTAPSGNVTISGPITVHTQATDAPGIARDMHAALANKVKAAKSNTGLQQ